MRHRFTTIAQQNNMKIQILEFIMSVGCKDIKNPPNHKIFYPILNFFFKKRKGVCTKQFRRSSAPAPIPTKSAKTDTHGKIKIYFQQMNVKQKYIISFPNNLLFALFLFSFSFVFFFVFLFFSFAYFLLFYFLLYLRK